MVTLLRIGVNIASVVIDDSADREAQQSKMFSDIGALLTQVDRTEQELLNSAISHRLQLIHPENRGTNFNLGGFNNITDLIQGTGGLIQNNTELTRKLIDETTFAFNILPEIGSNILISTWGQSNFRELESINLGVGNFANGEIIVGQLGLDTQLTPEFVVGASGYFSQTLIDYNTPNYEGEQVKVNSNQMNPYFAWSSDDNNSYFQTILSIGNGEIVLNENGVELEKFGTQLVSLALDGNLDLTIGATNHNGHGTEVTIDGSTFFANHLVKMEEVYGDDLAIATRNSRIAIEGSHVFALENGSILNPKSTIGLTELKYKDQSSIITEFSGGIEFSSSHGLEIVGEGSVNLSRFSQFHSLNFTNLIIYDLYQDELGILVNFSSEICPNCNLNSINLIETAYDDIKNRFELTKNNQEIGTNRISSEIAYGFEFGGGLGIWQPFIGFDFAIDDFSYKRLGGRVSTNSNLNFEFVGAKNQNIDSVDEYQLQFNGTFNW